MGSRIREENPNHTTLRDALYDPIHQSDVPAKVQAEELGISSSNVAGLRAQATDNPEINRLLGTEGNMGKMLGLSNDWAYNVISQVGNYSEVFNEFIGPNTPIGLARGLNAQYKDGGILYAPPLR